MSVNRSQIEPFRCEIDPRRAEVRLCPVGELDLATVPVVEAQLAELWSVGFTFLVLDLRDVSFLDSTALRMLLAWDAYSRADGLQFRVIRGSELVQRVLQIAGVADRLTYVSPSASANGGA
jgi:anti-sigma B factor antagonist